MSQEITQLVMIEVQPGKRQEQIDTYNYLLPLVSAEEGCLEYELKAVEGDENKFILVEKWASEAALEFHDNTYYMKKADSENHVFRAKPAEVVRLVDFVICDC